jgi:hypothetical protein
VSQLRAFRLKSEARVTAGLLTEISYAARKNVYFLLQGINFAWFYTPHGDSFTVNMGKISGSNVRAYWFDVRTGTVTYADTYVNSGRQAFDPPGTPAAGNDYVLLLDDASETFPIPGDYLVLFLERQFAGEVRSSTLGR